MRVFAIDPGPVNSAYVCTQDKPDSIFFEKIEFGIYQNDLILAKIVPTIDIVLIEKIASYGMGVGKDVFETVFWSGKFARDCERCGIPYERIERRKVKIHLCKDSRAKDSNVITAIVDKFDPMREYGKQGKGTKKNPGPFYGFAKDVWQAFALLITFIEGGHGETIKNSP